MSRSAGGRRARTRRAPAAWAARALLAAGLASLGYVSVAQTLGYTLRRGAAERAVALAPGDGRVLAMWSAAIAGAEATPADRRRADAVAVMALRRDPTAVNAVTTLGLDAQIRGNTAGARRLLTYAQALSRRDLRTQIWAVEDAVARGDVAGALHNHDLALRTSRSAPDLLFPVLASAIAEPAVRRAMVRTLAARPPWLGSFTEYLSGSGPDPRTTAILFGDLHHAGIVVSESARATLIGNLLGRSLVNEAWTLYALAHPGAERRMSRDPGFRSAATPSAFDWVPTTDGAMAASIQRGEQGGVFDFAAPASVGGAVLSQVQMLPPGSYALRGHGVGIDQPAASRPYWLLACANGRELGRVPLPNSVEAGGRFAGRFTVSGNCPVQILSLVVRPSDVVGGASGQIDRVQLGPAGEAGRDRRP